jgi:hypothetical protein
MDKPKPVFPPSLGKVPSMSNAALEEEGILHRLEQIICSLTPRSGNNLDPQDLARYLYERFLARLAARQKRKAGSASPSGIAKQLKEIARRSNALLTRLKRADKNVFDTWARSAEEYDRVLETPTQEWLQLKNLLEQAAVRATRGAQIADDIIRLKGAATIGKRGRPEDEIARVITTIVGAFFQEWTGSLAQRSISRDDGKPSGAFHDFLTEVFQILGIAASPDYSNDRLQKDLAKLGKSKVARK